MRSEVQALEAHQHTLFRHVKNQDFQQKFWPKYCMPKNAYFLEKRLESPLASGSWELRLQTPALLLPLTDIDLSKRVSSVKTILYFITLNPPPGCVGLARPCVCICRLDKIVRKQLLFNF